MEPVAKTQNTRLKTEKQRPGAKGQGGAAGGAPEKKAYVPPPPPDGPKIPPPPGMAAVK